MQKLSGNSLDKYNNSCSVFHQESNKIEFAFFRFSTEFTKISKNCFTIGDYKFQPGPWKDFGAHKYTLGSQKRTWKEVAPCNVVLWGGGWRARPRPRSGKGEGGVPTP
jgi:hypothetical protein